jgi:hypothetical protein
MVFTVDNPYPTYKSALTDEAGGTWPAGTYSFVVVAWYGENASESDADCAGLQRGAAALANWEITLAAADRKINIDWNAADRVPDHYSVYFQSGSTIDLDAIVTKCGGNIDRNTTSATLSYPNKTYGNVTTGNAAGTTLTDATDGKFETRDVIVGDTAQNVTDGSEGLVTVITSETVLTNVALAGGTDDEWAVADAYEIKTFATFGAAASSVTLNPIVNLGHQERKHTATGFDGKLVKKSFASSAQLETVTISTIGSSYDNTTGMADYQDLMKWLGYSVDVKLEDGDSGALIQTYYGRIIGLPDYLGTLQKTSGTVYNIIMGIERTSTS